MNKTQYKAIIRNTIETRAKEAGSLRELGRQTGIDSATLSKMKNGKLIPSVKQWLEYFPGTLPDMDPVFLASEESYWKHKYELLLAKTKRQVDGLYSIIEKAYKELEDYHKET